MIGTSLRVIQIQIVRRGRLSDWPFVILERFYFIDCYSNFLQIVEKDFPLIQTIVELQSSSLGLLGGAGWNAYSFVLFLTKHMHACASTHACSFTKSTDTKQFLSSSQRISCSNSNSAIHPVSH